MRKNLSFYRLVAAECEIIFTNVNVKVPITDSLKYLGGLLIDSQLTLGMQIREKCRTAARNVHLIRRICGYLTTESCH